MVSIIESRVIEELKKSYDPVLMNEQEIWVEYNRIANSIGVEAEDVQRICEKWQFDKIREDMAEMDKSINKKFKNGEYEISQEGWEDDGYAD